jgi:transcription initiation factor TFIIIB Brf1 subunit/transcription initiation factor TFIIB
MISNVNFDNIDKMLKSDDFKNYCSAINPKHVDLKSTNDKIHKCHACNSYELVYDNKNGIVVCNDCGQELNNIIDSSNEWNSYDCFNNNARINILANNPAFQSSYTTNKMQYYRTVSYKYISFNKECKILNSICEKYKIPKNIEYDAKILRKLISEYKHTSGKNIGKLKIIRGNNRVSINANCIYLACLQNNYAITILKLANMFEISEKEINKGYKMCKSILHDDKITLKYMTPAYFITNYCNELKIKPEDQIMAQEITSSIDKLKIATNFTTISLAAASILLTCNVKNLGITKQQIAQLFNISVATIFKAYKTIIKYQKILIDTTYTELIIDDINKKLLDVKIPNNIKNKFIKYNINII